MRRLRYSCLDCVLWAIAVVLLIPLLLHLVEVLLDVRLE
jgi:hypothetical protein